MASEANPGKTAGFSGGMAQTSVRHGSNKREARLHDNFEEIDDCETYIRFFYAFTVVEADNLEILLYLDAYFPVFILT